MNKSMIALLFGLLIVQVSYGQEDEKSKISYGFNLGVDNNVNAYRMTADNQGFTYYAMNPGISGGLDVRYHLNPKFSLRFEAEYFALPYGMDWNYGAESDFTQTRTYVHYAGLNLSADYALWTGKRLQLSLAPGVVTDVALGHSNSTLMSDGDRSDADYNVLSVQYPRIIAGLNLSMPIRVKLNDFYTLRLEPGATCFLNNYLGVNDKLYTRQSFKVGIEYRF